MDVKNLAKHTLRKFEIKARQELLKRSTQNRRDSEVVIYRAAQDFAEKIAKDCEFAGTYLVNNKDSENFGRIGTVTNINVKREGAADMFAVMTASTIYEMATHLNMTPTELFSKVGNLLVDSDEFYGKEVNSYVKKV